MAYDIVVNKAKAFEAVGVDEFGNEIVGAAVGEVLWTVTDLATVDSAGLVTAGTVAGTAVLSAEAGGFVAFADLNLVAGPLAGLAIRPVA